MKKLKMSTYKLADSPRMSEPATEIQIKWLEASFDVYDKTKSYTKRDCAEIIANFPASQEQIRLLQKKGYDVSSGVTIGQFNATIRI